MRCSGWWQRTKDWWTKDPPEDERRIRDSDFPNLDTHNSEREFYEQMKGAESYVKGSKPLQGKYFTQDLLPRRKGASWLKWDWEMDDTDLIHMRLHNRRMRDLKESQK